MSTKQKQAVIGTLGLLLGPFVLYTPWLIATDVGRLSPSRFLSLAAFGASVILGVWFLWRLPIPTIAKICTVPVYIIVAGYVLSIYIFVIAGVVFGRWL